MSRPLINAFGEEPPTNPVIFSAATNERKAGLASPAASTSLDVADTPGAISVTVVFGDAGAAGLGFGAAAGASPVPSSSFAVVVFTS